MTTAGTRLRVVSISKVLMQDPAILTLHKHITQRIEFLDRSLRRLIAEKQVPLVKDIFGQRQPLPTSGAFIMIPDSALPGIDNSVTVRAGNTGVARPDSPS